MEPLFTGQPLGTEAVPGTSATWITPETAANAIQRAAAKSRGMAHQIGVTH
jgi:hypothetical protein